MTYRTTPALVQGIIPDADTSVDLTPFIAIANQITTDACGPFITGRDSQGNAVVIDSSYTDGFIGSKMELIERWLSAHFYHIYDNQLAMGRAGSVGASFQYKVGFGLRNTMYGQSAIRLDTGGALAGMDNIDQVKRKLRIGGFWAGRQLCGSTFGEAWTDLISTEM